MKLRSKVLPAAVLTSAAMVLTFVSGSPVAAADTGRTYFVSASSGSDANRGTSAAHPWRSFAPVNALTLHPGDRVLLRSGDTWTGQELDPKGSGTPQSPIVISSYLTGPRPHIAPGIGVKTYAIHLVDNGGYNISNLEISDTYGGVVSYDTTGDHRYLHITNSVFHDITGKDTGFVIQPSDPSPDGAPAPDLYFGTAVGFGGNDGPTLFSDIVLDRDTFYRDDAAFDQVLHGPAPTHVEWQDLSITNSQIYDMYRTGGIMIYGTSDVLINHVRLNQASGYDNVGMFWGDGAVQITYSQDVTGQNSEILNTRNTFIGQDVAGFDFEGMNINAKLLNSYLTGNEGEAIETWVGWGGPSTGTVVDGDRLDNNRGCCSGWPPSMKNVFLPSSGNDAQITNTTLRLQTPDQPFDAQPNFLDPSSSIVYRPDGSQVFGDTHPSADLSVHTRHAGDTYLVTVHNNGANPAPNTTLTLAPATANGAATKVATTAGYCWLPLLEDNGATNCLLGTLQPGQTATVVAHAAPGSNTYPAATADVSSGITDPNPTNNQAQQ